MQKKKRKSSKLLTAYVLSISICACLIAILVLIPEPQEETKPTGVPIEEYDDEQMDILEEKELDTSTKFIYLIIDDAGYNLDQLEGYLRFPGKLTISILPRLQYSKASADLSVHAGKDYILHQPMEAINGENPGPGAIHGTMSEEEIAEVLTENLNSVPGTMGMNNHMGSKSTAQNDIMASIMKYLKENDLFFIDSYTNPESIAATVAEAYGVTCYKRNVFLDNSSIKEDIVLQLEKGLHIAEEEGMAILIGHVWSHALLDVLNEHYQRIINEGYTFKGITDLYSLQLAQQG